MTYDPGDLGPQGGAGSGVEDTRQRILDAAAQMFAEEGYARATTRALAAAAGVNEVTLFRHFGNKRNLFAAVVEEYAAPGLTAALQPELSGDYRQDLVTMGSEVLNLMLERRDAVRLMLCEAEHFPQVREVIAQNPRRLRQALSAYLRMQVEQGQVRRLHTEAAAQAFWGMFFAYSISLWLLDEAVQPELEPEELVAQFVDIFVRGTVNREVDGGVQAGRSKANGEG
jgi:AcrR family transcriptional regulator